MEMLARAGAFDALDPNRRRVLESVDQLSAYSGAIRDEQGSGQSSLFGGPADLPAPRLPQPEAWAPTERLAEEHAAVGFYLSGHPLDDYLGPLKRKRVQFYVDLPKSGGSARIAGSVMKRQERKSARGNRFAFVELSDPTCMYEVTVFSDVLLASRDLLEPGRNVVLTVEAEADGDQLKLLCRGVMAVDDVVADAAAAGLRVYVAEERALTSVKTRLEDAKQGARRRGGPVEIILSDPALGAEVEVALPGEWPVTPQIIGAIKAAPGVSHVEAF
jgi:DNA polymerase-3 subunit alpha